VRFRYLRDPLFMFCVLLYFVNRLVLKPHLPNEFLHSYLNDLICIPFWVPIMLFLMRKTGLRTEDSAPRSYEILVPLIIWSVVFELILPRLDMFRGRSFSDPRDIVFYTLGALLAAVFWRIWYGRRGNQRELGAGR
jgi:hypothetical protein